MNVHATRQRTDVAAESHHIDDFLDQRRRLWADNVKTQDLPAMGIDHGLSLLST